MTARRTVKQRDGQHCSFRHVSKNSLDSLLGTASQRSRAPEVLENFSEFDSLHAVIGMKAIVDSAIMETRLAATGQLRDRFRVSRCPAPPATTANFGLRGFSFLRGLRLSVDPRGPYGSPTR